MSTWLFFEITEFLNLARTNHPLVFCIIKISVITSNIIGHTTSVNDEAREKLEILFEKFKFLFLMKIKSKTNFK